MLHTKTMNYTEPKFNTTYTQTKNFKFAIHAVGHGSKKVVCIPPFPSPSIAYIYSLKHLPEAEFTLYLIDLPGIFGDSHSSKNASFEELNREIEQIVIDLVKDTNPTDAQLVANSYGATLALGFSTKTLEKFDQVYLVSPIIKNFMSYWGIALSALLSLRLFRILLGWVITKRYDGFIKSFFKEIFSPKQFKFLDLYLEKVDYDELSQHLLNLLRVDLTRELKNLPSRNLKIYFGDSEEKVFADQTKYIESAGLTVKLIPGKHYSFMCEPQLATEELISVVK